jgi:hypothetical protein
MLLLIQYMPGRMLSYRKFLSDERVFADTVSATGSCDVAARTCNLSILLLFLTALIQRSGRLPLQLETQELGVRSQAATNVDTTGTTTDFMLRQILDSRA